MDSDGEEEGEGLITVRHDGCLGIGGDRRRRPTPRSTSRGSPRDGVARPTGAATAATYGDGNGGKVTRKSGGFGGGEGEGRINDQDDDEEEGVEQPCTLFPTV